MSGMKRRAVNCGPGSTAGHSGPGAGVAASNGRVLHALAAGFCWCLLLSGVAFAGEDNGKLKMRSLDPPVLLPDGSEFKTWEQTPEFSRTYHVDAKNPAAADTNPGTREKPFRTIGRAAEVLRPGERVVVAAGIYREHVRIPRGGTGPTRMISYEAAPGARVIVRGSNVFGEKWTRAKGLKKAWRAKLDPKYFRGYRPFATHWRKEPRQEDTQDHNPFALANPVLDTPGAQKYWGKLKDREPFKFVRGLIFQNGKRLAQVGSRKELAGRAGRYFVDRARQVLYVRPFGDADPNAETIEITTRVSCFSGTKIETGFVRIRGFIVEHTAGPFPVPQVGAISTWRGHHWIIEDNTVRWSNGVGIDGGMQTFFGNLKRPRHRLVSRHIIRRNTVTDCGICGICSAGRTFETLVEDNVVKRNAWQNAAVLPELAGIKLHHNIRTLIRRNLVVNTHNGDGIWMDFGNENSRCCRNVIVSTRCERGGIFIEASRVPNLIDSNFIWGSVRLGKNGGTGIWEKWGINQVFAHNFVCGNQGHAFHIGGGPVKRRSYGHYDWPAGPHKVRNNILAGKGGLYRVDGPRDVAGDLTKGVTFSFDPEKMELSWSVRGKIPKCRPVKAVVRDFFGRKRDPEKTVPGPFSELPRGKTTVRLWPVIKPE